METVGVKALKAHLSEYLHRVGEGENFVVTHHGREVAMMVPLNAERRTILELRRSGAAQWEGRKPRGLRGVEASGGSVAEELLEERR